MGDQGSRGSVGFVPSVDEGARPVPLAIPRLPVRADDVELVGELAGDAFEQQQYLVLRGKTFVQVSEVLYRTLEHSDGAHSIGDIAFDVGGDIGRPVSSEGIELLLREKLIPLGLVKDAAEHEPRSTGHAVRSPMSAMSVNLRARIDGRYVNPVAGALRFLHAPVVAASVLIAALIAHVWLYVVHGATDTLRPFVTHPDVMMVVLPVMLLAAAFHELGHASALRYEGGRVRGMGAGVYLVFPVLYTDVTEAYRMSRRQRLRVDLGGPYFHVVFGLAVTGLYFVTGTPWLLTVAVLTDLEVVRQFMPIGRLDGYWIAADLTGIPDFLTQLVPFATGLLPIPAAAAAAPAPVLRRRTRRIFLGYIAAFVIGFPVFLIVTLVHLPGFAVAAWGTARVLARALVLSVRVGDYSQVASSTLQLLFLALQAAAIVLFFYLVGWRPARRMWIQSREQPREFRMMTRAGLFLLPAAVLTAVGVWYPWRSIHLAALGLTRHTAGVASIPGRILFVAGIVTLVAAVLVLFGWDPTVRRFAAIAAVICGIGGIGVAAYNLQQAPHLVDEQARSVVESTTGHEPNPHEVAIVRDTFDSIGFEITPGYGVHTVAAGGIAAVLAGVGAWSALAMLTRRLSRTGDAATEHLQALDVDEARRRRFARTVRAAAVAATVASVGFILWPTASPTIPQTPVPPTESRSPVGELIWPPNAVGLPGRLERLGFPMLRREALAYHVHAHLDIWVGGRKVLVPPNVGIDVSRDFLTVLHTHSADGVIHVESPVKREFTLGQFFRVWGVRLDAECLGSYCETRERRLRAYVDGRRFSGNPASIPLADHAEIVLAFGTTAQMPASVPSSYRFPRGL